MGNIILLTYDINLIKEIANIKFDDKNDNITLDVAILCFVG